MALTKRGKEAAAYLDNPNVRIMLQLIQEAEGAVHGYHTAFGGGKIESLDDHPRTVHEFTQTDKKKNKTTAAGGYQFLEKTWDDVAGKLGLPNFGEESQDLAAIELLRRAGALDAAATGDFETAISKSGTTWASLPSSPYAQPTRSQDWVDNFMARQAGDTEATPFPALQDDLSTIEQLLAGAGANPAQQPSLFDQEPAQPSWQDDLYAMLSSRMNSGDVDAAPLATGDANMEAWESQIIQDSLNDEGENARAQAIATFFGQTAAPLVSLPRPVEKLINTLIAQI